MIIRTAATLSAAMMLGLAVLAGGAAGQSGNVFQATLAEPDQKTNEVSTEQLHRILVDGSAIVVDARPHKEYVAGHIPGARNLADPPSTHVAALQSLVGGDKSKALVLYCNGPFCQASSRLADQLVAAGFT